MFDRWESNCKQVAGTTQFSPNPEISGTSVADQYVHTLIYANLNSAQFFFTKKKKSYVFALSNHYSRLLQFLLLFTSELRLCGGLRYGTEREQLRVACMTVKIVEDN